MLMMFPTCPLARDRRVDTQLRSQESPRRAGETHGLAHFPAVSNRAKVRSNVQHAEKEALLVRVRRNADQLPSHGLLPFASSAEPTFPSSHACLTRSNALADLVIHHKTPLLHLTPSKSDAHQWILPLSLSIRGCPGTHLDPLHHGRTVLDEASLYYPE